MSEPGLRIAIDGRPALWPRTGIGTIAHGVLANMQKLDLGGEVYAYFDADPGERRQNYGRVRCAHGGPRHKLLWSNTWLVRQLKRDAADVLVTFLDKEIPLLPTRARIVTMVHDLIPLRFPQVVFRNAAHRLYYETLIRAAAQRSDMILTNSEFSRREIVAGLGVQEAKVQKVSLGVEKAGPLAVEEVDAVLLRLGLKRPFVLAVGSTEPRKNNGQVIEAMRRLALRHPRLRLAIAGAAWRGIPFEPGSLDARVHLLGHVADPDMPLLMSAAEMLVFPSLHEGFGFPVLEAMSLGVPVVTSRATALPEVGGDAVLYTDPNSAADIAAQMHRILADAELAATLRSKGRERAMLFRWEKTCAEIAMLCAGLTASRPWSREPVML